MLLQPDQVPVQEEKGPQPAVQVVQALHGTPLASVPQGPPKGPPAPPGPPWPPHAPGPPHPPWPFQPEGAEGKPVEAAEIQLDQAPEFQLPPGPKPGAAVICEGQAEPPEVALKLAS